MCSPRRVFDETKPSATPILFPALFVSIACALILWVLCPIFYTATGISKLPTTSVGVPLIELRISSIPALLLFVPSTVLGYIVYLVLIGTYFFVVARCFNIKTAWEYWFGFTCWTHIPMVITAIGVSVLLVYSSIGDPSTYVVVILSIPLLLLPLVWTGLLSAIGLRTWTTKGRAFCIGFGVLPYVFVLILSISDFIVWGLSN